jgi:hypothetical protein
MNCVSVRDRILVVTEILLGAAHADAPLQPAERGYLCDLVADLLCTSELPEELALYIDGFDRRSFDLRAAAREFQRQPPMSGRRLLELVACVTLADGAQSADESAFVRALGEALGLAPEGWQDLTGSGLAHCSAIVGARVPLRALESGPGPQPEPALAQAAAGRAP